MKKRFAYLLGAVCLSAGLAACSQDEETSTKQPEPETEVDTDNQASVEQGEKIAKTSCITCHGADLSGDMGPDLHNLTLSKDEIIEVLKKGRKAMPPATAAGHEEEVAAYLLTLK